MGWTRRGAPVKLHVLTAVTRPGNLGQVGESIALSAELAPEVTVCWHLQFDHEREHVGGQALKNRMLDGIDDGWVCILDDDTLMHDRFVGAVYRETLREPPVRAVVVSQLRTTGQVLRAGSANAVLGKIDAGQAVLRRDLIGEHRIPETYAGDGVWLEALLRNADVRYLKIVLSLHNAISGIDVSEPPERMQA